MRRAVVITAVALCASTSDAQERISPEAFLDAAEGRTLTFNIFPDGYLVGVEEFLRRDLSVWREAGGDCVYGDVSVQGDQLCFLYDDDADGEPVCWATFAGDEGLFVMGIFDGGTEIQQVTDISDETLECPIKPGV